MIANNLDDFPQGPATQNPGRFRLFPQGFNINKRKNWNLSNKNYVLPTDNDEIFRLNFQHHILSTGNNPRQRHGHRIRDRSGVLPFLQRTQIHRVRLCIVSYRMERPCGRPAAAKYDDGTKRIEAPDFSRHGHQREGVHRVTGLDAR
ncbi:hypothetical protein BC936DRAFT_145743 [Jimgerdemannia flammicorona]|uniref:Uncharacterized protein n=1 Tax=Jimgerdemannia flammicorona TaxID=994334 RepID=A0A433D964_9FUNG|nr:hypothetical protein BC936DRAFT_145743 [Jimgerdemannia flammicorona]